MSINNFVMIESVHGKFIVNRHCLYQAEHLIKTGATHIESELKNMFKIISLVEGPPVVLDVGANIGFVSIPVANYVKGRGGVVHAFEAQRMLYNALCGSAALNDLDNLFISNAAVGAHKGTLKVPTPDYGKPQDFGTVSLCDQESLQSFDCVDVLTIDDLGLERLDFLKVDVEGMEIEVLSGAQKTIKKYRPYCWVEYHMVDRELFKEMFASMNYSVFIMDHLNVACFPNEIISQKGLSIQANTL